MDYPAILSLVPSWAASHMQGFISEAPKLGGDSSLLLRTSNVEENEGAPMVRSSHRSMDLGEEPRRGSCHLETLGRGLEGDSQGWSHPGPGLHCLMCELGSWRPHCVGGKDLFHLCFLSES